LETFFNYYGVEEEAMDRNLKVLNRLMAATLLATLAACGGGGSGGAGTPTLGSGSGTGNASGGGGLPAATGPVVTGTAATGAALSGATVSAKCAIGSGSATTSSSGAYSVSVSNGGLPCVLTATSADSNTVLHSVAAGTGTGAATSNITPLSELLVAQLAGTDPVSYAAQFNSNTSISSDAVATAQGALLQILVAAGVDTSAVTDILSGSLNAGSGTGYDGVLDKLQATIAAAGTSLSELSTSVATSSSAGSATGATTVSTVLAVASSDCAALKSGSHRLVDFSTWTNQLVTIDASAMTATVGGSTYALSRNSSCDYTLNDATSTRVLVAKSGIAAWVKGSGLNALGISLPAQTLDIASLAGVYNRSSYHGAAVAVAPPAGEFGTVTFNAAGVNTASTNCANGYGSCVLDAAPQNHLAVNNAGGFDLIDDGAGGSVGARVFGFRNATGNTVLVAQQADGTLSILSAQGALSLPAVGTSNAFWQFTLSNTGTSTVTGDSNSVTAVDTATSKVTRQFASDSHTDVVSLNDPYPGMRYRPSSGCIPAGSCGTALQSVLLGTGLTINVSPVKHNMTVSINKP